MKHIAKLLTSIWVLIGMQACSASDRASATFVTPYLCIATGGYDGQKEIKTAYDARPRSTAGYDAITALAVAEKRDGLDQDYLLLANYPHFLAAEGGAETFYRTMSQAHYDQLLATGRLPATSETFISPSLQYAQQYNGVTVQFGLRAGTSDSLLGMGVRNTGLSGGAYDALPLVQSLSPKSAFLGTASGEGCIGKVFPRVILIRGALGAFCCENSPFVNTPPPS